MCACTVPLAPGYRIQKESLEVQFVSGQPPELHVRARFTLQNSGTSALTFVDVALPDEKLIGRKKLRVEVDGRENTLTNLPAEFQAEAPNTHRLPLDVPWRQEETRECAIEYVLSSPEDSGTRITIGENSFHLGSRGWLARLLPPKRMFAPYPRRPDRTIYTVRVPADFVVLARGTLAGRKQEGGEVEYRFELLKEDLLPFIVAGHYVEPTAPHKRASAVFWTLQPLKEDPGLAEERIAAAWAILQTDFGPLDKNIRVPHVVESPELRVRRENEADPAFASFPGGVLINPAALALGLRNEDFLERVIHSLAHNWFGDEMFPNDGAAVGMGEGLPEYATIVIDEARNGEAARQSRIIEFLRRYDEARKGAVEKPLAVTTMLDPPEQRRIGLAKAPLFLVALEDACGEAPMRAGLAHLVALLRGQEVGFDDLRAALEQSTGKNLAETFRVWLNEKGIPAEFRDRYEGRRGE